MTIWWEFKTLGVNNVSYVVDGKRWYTWFPIGKGGICSVVPESATDVKEQVKYFSPLERASWCLRAAYERILMWWRFR